ncbi:transcriptional regulator [Mangrovimicrobium sediminis]|uniref:Transcriptional regulator n=1 Tax=Mangrovimicrobium sediminis TaxID=2562682 RepID=A0A4Z0M5W3_9GAMM|nr:ChrR family anti-sigma-E factor [Haliea sp. SAOS-164]TGD74797.1 transcriptional regulator [Haliea sp. SAOS-164]
MVSHHPDTRLLNEHAAGALDLAPSVCVTLHLNYCEQCRRAHRQLRDLGAGLFDRLPPQAVSENLMDAVMARLDHEPEPLSYRATAAAEGCPPLVQRLMQRDYQDLDWRKIGSQVRICHLRTGDQDNEFALYHIRAGGRIPRHTHRGTELTLVLEGSFSDESGHYEAGDFLMRDGHNQHTPTATRDRDCICVGVLDAPVRFTDWRFRAANPFLRLNAC